MLSRGKKIISQVAKMNGVSEEYVRKGLIQHVFVPYKVFCNLAGREEPGDSHASLRTGSE